MTYKIISKFTLRTNPTLLKKFHLIADYNGRSSNKEMELLIKKYITDFEKQHGKLPIEKE